MIALSLSVNDGFTKGTVLDGLLLLQFVLENPCVDA